MESADGKGRGLVVVDEVIAAGQRDELGARIDVGSS